MTLKAKMILNGPKRRDFYAELIEKCYFVMKLPRTRPNAQLG